MVGLRQFDVCRLGGSRRASDISLVVILQHDALNRLTTRVVAPLIPMDTSLSMPGVIVEVDIEGVRHAVALHLMSAVSTRELGPTVLNLDDQQAALKSALDLLFLGF